MTDKRITWKASALICAVIMVGFGLPFLHRLPVEPRCVREGCRTHVAARRRGGRARDRQPVRGAHRRVACHGARHAARRSAVRRADARRRRGLRRRGVRLPRILPGGVRLRLRVPRIDGIEPLLPLQRRRPHARAPQPREHLVLRLPRPRRGLLPQRRQRRGNRRRDHHVRERAHPRRAGVHPRHRGRGLPHGRFEGAARRVRGAHRHARAPAGIGWRDPGFHRPR